MDSQGQRVVMKLGINAFNIRVGGGLYHLVELLSSVNPLDYGFSTVVLWANQATLSKVPDKIWLQKVEVRALNKGWLSKLYWSFFIFPKEARHCDLLFVPGGSYLGRFKPFVNMFQNVVPFEPKERSRYLLKSPGLYVKYALLRMIQGLTCKRAQGAVFPSGYAKKLIYNSVKQMDTQRCTIISHGINPIFRDAFVRDHSSKLDGVIRLLYVSTIDLYKHQWHLIKAAQMLRQKGFRVVLDLVGSVGNASALSRLQSAMKQADPSQAFIYYRGSVDYLALPALYHQADIFVFASSCESISSIVLEAMASRLPIACSNRSVMPEVLRDAGVYFDPEDIGSIVEAISCLIEDGGLRQSCADKAAQYASGYSWELCANQTFSFLKQIATESKV